MCVFGCAEAALSSTTVRSALPRPIPAAYARREVYTTMYNAICVHNTLYMRALVHITRTFVPPVGCTAEPKQVRYALCMSTAAYIPCRTEYDV